MEFDNFVETSDDAGGSYYLLLRTLSICLQKGRKTMPKHVALGLTMRHMTGSSSLIGILNGFGHLVSHSGVLKHDTARENKQLCTENIVPEGFIKKISTRVIWDNNEFREETPSGEGTTHNTNGLLGQRIGCVDDGTESIACINSESKHLPKKRSVDPPPKRKRQGPTPTSYQSVIHEHSTNQHLQFKQSLDSGLEDILRHSCTR